MNARDHMSQLPAKLESGIVKDRFGRFYGWAAKGNLYKDGDWRHSRLLAWFDSRRLRSKVDKLT